MSDPIFLRTRHDYDPYSDYWKLIELSGFSWLYVDQLDVHSAHTYIVSPMSGEFSCLDWWGKDKTCKIYHWNLERPCDGTLQDYINANNVYMDGGLVDVTLVSDMRLAKDTGFHYVPLGGHAEFGQPGADKSYDFIHLMCYNYRRSQTKLFRHVTPKDELEGMKIAPNGWGAERDAALKATKFMLNVHQDDHQYIEPLRFVIAACYGLPILSETVHNSYPYKLAQFNVLKGLHREMKRVLSEYDNLWKSVGVEMRNIMTQDFTFRQCVERYL